MIYGKPAADFEQATICHLSEMCIELVQLVQFEVSRYCSDHPVRPAL